MHFAPIPSMTIRALLAEAEHALAKGPHPEKARRDAAALLLYVLQRVDPERNLAWMIAHDAECVPADVAAEMGDIVKRRAAGEPNQYITGEAEFYRLPLVVNRDVLIPRPETEQLVEKAIEAASCFPGPRILDVGTGSGAIALALAHELPDAIVTATEISERALSTAGQNADRLGLTNRIRFLVGDLIKPVADERFDMVVSNPPYVALRDSDSLSIEVRSFEPAQALFAGEDGLAVYQRLLPAAFEVLVAGGFVLLEIGCGQSEPVNALMRAAGFEQIAFAPDLQGIMRVAMGRKP